jgi:hypothetical protein
VEPGTRLAAALWITDGYFSVIAPHAAAAILKRDPTEAPALATWLRLRPADSPGRTRARHVGCPATAVGSDPYSVTAFGPGRTQ